MSNEKIENFLLAAILAEPSAASGLKLERVSLQPGPLAAHALERGACVYFPIDALLAQGATQAQQAVATVVGWHGCAESSAAVGEFVQTAVMVPGQAYRVDMMPVQQNPALHAAWLWGTAAATQSLIRQMAQWSFCAQHHSPRQRLCSWLLHCVAQSPRSPLKINLTALPWAIRQMLDPVQWPPSDPPSTHGFELQKGYLQVLSPPQLAAGACACHHALAPAKA